MKRIDQINDDIEKTMNSLEGIQQAGPNAYFYARLHARMERELLEPKTVLGFRFKPIYAYSTLAIILLINVFTIMNLRNNEPLPEKQIYSLYNANGI